MKTHFRKVIFLILAFFFSSINAQERMINEVIDEVYSFLTSDSIINERGFSTSDLYKSQMQVSRIQRGNTTYFYVVNMPDKGWAVVSNEQQYPFLIGYSTESNFDTNTDNQPAALRLLLEQHMDMIDSLHESPHTFHGRYFSLSPISLPSSINSKNIENSCFLIRNGEENCWGQNENNDTSSNYDCDKVYNKLCPTCVDKGCGHALVGCTAVAIAQVLWYWRWPDYTYLRDGVYCSGITYGNLKRHYYEWDSIPPQVFNYTSLYQADKVAELLRDCGIAAHMVYTTLGSSADVLQLEDALDAFYVHWKYNFDYAWTNVTSLLLGEMQARRPVICQAGESGSIGIHTFVIDGYDSSTGLFHVNFGWNGQFNGMWNTGFNGYTVARSFFTELYPNCLEREASVSGLDTDTILTGKNATIYTANDVCLSHLIISNGGHLNVSVGGSAILGSGFNAQFGSYVKLSPNYNCSTGSSPAPVSIQVHKASYTDKYTQKTNLFVTPNLASREISIHSDIPIETIDLYDINGRAVLQSRQTQIDLSHTPKGVYIIRVTTVDGQIQQTKFIHE